MDKKYVSIRDVRNHIRKMAMEGRYKSVYRYCERDTMEYGYIADRCNRTGCTIEEAIKSR